MRDIDAKLRRWLDADVLQVAERLVLMEKNHPSWMAPSRRAGRRRTHYAWLETQLVELFRHAGLRTHDAAGCAADMMLLHGLTRIDLSHTIEVRMAQRGLKRGMKLTTLSAGLLHELRGKRGTRKP